LVHQGTLVRVQWDQVDISRKRLAADLGQSHTVVDIKATLPTRSKLIGGVITSDSTNARWPKGESKKRKHNAHTWDVS
jgi:hypothetical protein